MLPSLSVCGPSHSLLSVILYSTITHTYTCTCISMYKCAATQAIGSSLPGTYVRLVSSLDSGTHCVYVCARYSFSVEFFLFCSCCTIARRAPPSSVQPASMCSQEWHCTAGCVPLVTVFFWLIRTLPNQLALYAGRAPVSPLAGPNSTALCRERWLHLAATHTHTSRPPTHKGTEPALNTHNSQNTLPLSS